LVLHKQTEKSTLGCERTLSVVS